MKFENYGYFVKCEKWIYINLSTCYIWTENELYAGNFIKTIENSINKLSQCDLTRYKKLNAIIDFGEFEKWFNKDIYEEGLQYLAREIKSLNFIDNIYRRNNDSNSIFYEKIEYSETEGLKLSEVAGGSEDSNRISKIMNSFLNEYSDFLIVKYAIKKIENKKIYLESSNVFANEYVLVKNLFLDTFILNYFIYELFKLINKYLNDRGIKIFDVKLISASDTGAMIVTALLHLINKFHSYEKRLIMGQHLLHLGPTFSFNMSGITLDELQGNKYIYVYDFMCEGSEYRLVKNCLEMNKANLIGAVGIAKYNGPRKVVLDGSDFKVEFDTTNILQVVDMEKWKKGKNGYYEITYSQENNE